MPQQSSEPWMHTRTKFDGRKVINRSQSGSWKHRYNCVYFKNRISCYDNKNGCNNPGFWQSRRDSATSYWWKVETREKEANNSKKIISLKPSTKWAPRVKKCCTQVLRQVCNKIRTYQWEWNEESVCWENAGNPPWSGHTLCGLSSNHHTFVDCSQSRRSGYWPLDTQPIWSFWIQNATIC